MKKYKKVAALILGFILLSFGLYKAFWIFQMRDFPHSVKVPLKNVIEAYYLGKITGEYWENQFEKQAEIIAGLPQDERVSFFRGVMLLTCDLDTSRATTFIYRLGNDAKALREDLINLKGKESFQSFSKKQQEETLNWIEELKIVIKQQSQ